MIGKQHDHEGDLQGVDDTRNIPKNRQEDIDQQVGIAATLEEDTHRGNEDGEDDFANIAIGNHPR